MSDTEIHYVAEYQDGSAVSGDAEQGGTWYVAGDIYGYPTVHDARDVLDAAAERKILFGRRIWRITTTQELV